MVFHNYSVGSALPPLFSQRTPPAQSWSKPKLLRPRNTFGARPTRSRKLLRLVKASCERSLLLLHRYRAGPEKSKRYYHRADERSPYSDPCGVEPPARILGNHAWERVDCERLEYCQSLKEDQTSKMGGREQGETDYEPPPCPKCGSPSVRWILSIAMAFGGVSVVSVPFRSITCFHSPNSVAMCCRYSRSSSSSPVSRAYSSTSLAEREALDRQLRAELGQALPHPSMVQPCVISFSLG